jgi:hypothetical protein
MAVRAIDSTFSRVLDNVDAHTLARSEVRFATEKCCVTLATCQLSEAIRSQYDAMEKPQAHHARHILSAPLEYRVEFTVRINSIDGRAPTGIENSLRLSSSVCSSLSGRAPKISHKAHTSKLFALVVLQGQWRCPLKQRFAWWKWLVNRLLLAPCSLI